MPFLLLGLGLLLLLLLLGGAFINADPAKLGRFLRWFLLSFAVAGAAALLILLIVSDRLAPALALVAVAGPFLMRSRALWRRWFAAAPSTGQTSTVETDLLRMELDHDTGAMTGTVRRGAFAGRRLSELADAELLDLWRQCRAEEEASARLVEAYLDRLRPDWREAAAGGAAPSAPSEIMTREEAYAILGLAPGADADAIKKAHRALMMKLHPDQGGSTYLAAKINRAKEVLLED